MLFDIKFETSAPNGPKMTLKTTISILPHTSTTIKCPQNPKRQSFSLSMTSCV